MVFGVFKKKKKSTAISGSPIKEGKIVAGTNIHYQPDFIANMKADHAHLLNLYTDIKMAAGTKDFIKVAAVLNEFRAELEEHLLKENVSLYVYLIHLLKNDKEKSELITGFKKEMNAIAIKFLAKYEAVAKDAQLHGSFDEEFAVIGKVLGERIKREEEILYTLYLPRVVANKGL